MAVEEPWAKRQLPRVRPGSVSLRWTLNSMYLAPKASSFPSIPATTLASHVRSDDDTPVTSPCRQDAGPSALCQRIRIAPGRRCCAERRHGYPESIAPTDCGNRSRSSPPHGTRDRPSEPPHAWHEQLPASSGRWLCSG